MDAARVHSVVLVENKLSKVEILRGLITERMTVAVREILAVVETTVSGYEDEVSSLNRELVRYKRQLQAVLQPQIHLYRIDVVGTAEVKSNPSNDELSHQYVQTDAENIDCNASENRGDIIDDNITKVSLQEHEESDCNSADLPNKPLLDSCPTSREESLRDESVTDVKITKSKRRRRVPLRYRSNHNLTEGITDVSAKNRDEWMPSKSKKLRSSNVKKACPVKLKIGLLKNSPGSYLSMNAFRLEGPTETIQCRQNLSQLDFINRLTSNFPELGQNATFEAYLVNGTKKTVPLQYNKVTLDELYKAFKSQEQKQLQIYFQRKENGDTCDMLTNALLEQTPNSICFEKETHSETDDTSSSMDDTDNMESAQHEDDEWNPAQNNEDEARNASPSKKNTRKGTKQMLNCKPCQVCGYLYRSSLVLNKHALSHLDNPKLMCGVCGKQMESRENLKSHLESHGNLHQCETCGRYFGALRSLQLHIDTHRIQNPFKCEFCNKPFASNESLQEHKLIHKKETHYKCETCSKTFLFKGQYQNHCREHTRDKAFCCDVCGKSFSNFRGLCQHKILHTGEKNYKCQQCEKLFYTLRFLKRHEKIHTEREKKHLCDTCSKTFLTRPQLFDHLKRHGNSHVVKCPTCHKLLRGNLECHMRTHTGEKPFGCEQCDKKFKTQSQLKSHMHTVHLRIKNLTCAVCGYKCARKHYLDSHMMTHTGHKPHKCTLCDMAFTQSHCLKSHMKSHQTKDQSHVDALD